MVLMGLVWAGFLWRVLDSALVASPCGNVRHGTASLLLSRFLSYGQVTGLPLAGEVSFKTLLQKGNRVQVPRLVRWEFKMEPTQLLRVTVKPEEFYHSESFYAKMGRDGRIMVPWLVLDLLQKRAEGGESLTGQVLEVRIAPAEHSS
jgi:hypothetical protein